MKYKRPLFVALSLVLFGSLCAFSTGAFQQSDARSICVGHDTASVSEGTDVVRDNMNITLRRDFVPEDGENTCGSVIIGYAPKPEEHNLTDSILEHHIFSASKPTKFWNIARDGIYHGTLEGGAEAIYSQAYFDYGEDSGGDSDYCYYTRAAVSAPPHGETLTVAIQNHCTECGLLSSTPAVELPEEGTGYLEVKHYFSKAHEEHFMYPAIVCSNPSVQLEGTVEVNYDAVWQ